jgi:CBS domain containing-hemolysin-like protein
VSGLHLTWVIVIGIPALFVQSISVALSRALRVYSRSRLEDICEAHQRPSRADAIARHDEITERAAESLAVLSGLTIAVLTGANAVQLEHKSTALLVVLIMMAIATVDYVVSGAVGRVFAEHLLDRFWPIAPFVRTLATPLTLIGLGAEWLTERIWGEGEAHSRPTSVEVEIPTDEDHPEDEESDLPEATRDMLERVVELSRRDVSEVMLPRTAMHTKPATISAQDAAAAFCSTGLSRIPLFGENRDDIVGILYAKDLFPAMLAADDPNGIEPRRLVRPAYFVPDTKMASELLEELRSHRLQIAIVLDEYGGVAGLITLEDLLEEVVGPIHDEHDLASATDPIQSLGGSSYEVAATVPIEDVNERLGLHLNADGDVNTVGGYALLSLGRLPEAGTIFRQDGVEFTVLEVADHSIRKMRLEVVQE